MDVSGRAYPAQIVITQFIKALLDHVIKHLKKGMPDINKDTDVKWILTVPAIWNDAAKRYMRQCANNVSTCYNPVFHTFSGKLTLDVKIQTSKEI